MEFKRAGMGTVVELSFKNVLLEKLHSNLHHNTLPCLLCNDHPILSSINDIYFDFLKNIYVYQI